MDACALVVSAYTGLDPREGLGGNERGGKPEKSEYEYSVSHGVVLVLGIILPWTEGDFRFADCSQSFGPPSGCVTADPNCSPGVRDDLKAAALDQIAGYRKDPLHLNKT